MPRNSSSLERVNWHALDHAHSTAEDIPDKLRALWSADPEIRAAAYEDLAENLCHQHTQYQATAAAVPFVIDVVADPAAPDRAMACELLATLAIGDDYPWLRDPSRVDWLRHEVARKAAMTVDDLERDLAAWVAAAPTAAVRKARQSDAEWIDVEEDRDGEAWALQAYDAVRRGVPVYVEALSSEEAAVRLFAAHLLGWFPEDASTSLPHLARLLAAESDSAAAATALIAVGLLAGAQKGDLAVTVARRLDSSHALERWAAAITLARLRPSPPRAVVGELYDCVRHGDDLPQKVPYLDGDMSGLAAMSLTRLPHESAPDRLDVLLERLTVVPPGPSAQVLGGAIVEIAFPDGPVPDGTRYADLTEDQRKAVTALNTATASADSFWWNRSMRNLGLSGNLAHPQT